jgi:ectoine hydroxylase
MRLTDAQLAEYQRDGILFLPSLFTRQEIEALKTEQARILTLDLESHLRAASGEFLGTTAMDRVSPLYARLLRDERLLAIAEQLLGPSLYCHQYKVILKQPFGKLTLPWHQDFGPWYHHDGMPEPRAVSLSIYLDEVNEFNGPIMFIPGSHRSGLIEYEVLPVPGTTPIPSLPDATVARLAADDGIVAPKGPPGSVTIFDCCLAHASGPNQSPYPRHLIYLSYTPVTNAIRKPTRPTHFASQDFTPLVSAPSTALLG